ncbi:hypothetical protein K461DRAFT_280332 [Myriangium duriaei CBS 260.36]|uniref:Uncharacterized protein n=1 Tax=Myriangium duriaei CBS 260.36 TaxID=1168546 RepID=A0A9P4J0R5_9PEZI|nr:hypothetical protein K461DRAFT_280332 [Myriangium duriaei CBS 260.36]
MGLLAMLNCFRQEDRNTSKLRTHRQFGKDVPRSLRRTSTDKSHVDETRSVHTMEAFEVPQRASGSIHTDSFQTRNRGKAALSQVRTESYGSFVEIRSKSGTVSNRSNTGGWFK